ncbi:hypothetical protein [Microbacterium esteraromaticum]|uniref:hypothetical protein n=1 Tax=Microbacterium esteraromaticum TaxID=57043 RepID=UPI00195BFBA8|nr:hypothetical protein [Microbacterium esteraromaticum]MBM7466618.1 hypothetical protein [Microbacterium esteraromaticum]
MMTDTDDVPEVSRRTVVRGFAWSVPILAAAAAAPAWAVSGCRTFTTSFTTSSTVQNPTRLPATDGTRNLTVELTAVSGANTTVTQNGQTFNMTRSASGWNGGWSDDSAGDWVFTDFGPAGSIVLNQRSTTDASNQPIGSPTQTVTLTFLDGSTPVSVSNLRIDVYDITSANTPRWRDSYWDAVGFNIAPSSILPAPGKDQGLGAGTIADPFRRSTAGLSTGTGPYQDRFTFTTVPSSGLQLRYTSHQQKSGWQFISIAGITFDAC